MAPPYSRDPTLEIRPDVAAKKRSHELEQHNDVKEIKAHAQKITKLEAQLKARQTRLTSIRDA